MFFSYLFRQLSRRSKLYTEMYVDKTLLHQQDNLWNFLGHQAADGPLAIQLGGNDPDLLAQAGLSLPLAKKTFVSLIDDIGAELYEM